MKTVIITHKDRIDVVEALKTNDWFCPCKIDKNFDTKCKCLQFREQEVGPCECGLYEKVIVEDIIDDRAICFDGNTKDLINKINNFKPWNK